MVQLYVNCMNGVYSYITKLTCNVANCNNCVITMFICYCSTSEFQHRGQLFSQLMEIQMFVHVMRI